MKFSAILRQHVAALRALLVLTVIVGVAYPLFIWLVAQIPGLNAQAGGSIVERNGTPVASSLIGQSFIDGAGSPMPQYFQSRPSAAGDGYDPLATGASNLGPESIIDVTDTPSLLTLVCSRSKAVGELEGVDGARPFCTGGGVGAVLSVIGPRDARGNVTRPTRVVSLNEPCVATTRPFLDSYEGVPVECATAGEDYAVGQIVPIRGAASGDPAVPADAVSASGSGLDPHISPAYAELQVARVANARGVGVDQISQVLAQHTAGRTLGIFGQPRVNVVELNIALDENYPLKS
jgi:K+-transporting ATPase ATPase C chain